jgi:hypothetical protein
MIGVSIFINYLIAALCVQRIAGLLGTSKGWMAWIPFLNWYLACRLAKVNGWFFVIWLIPVVNIVWMIWLWRRILARMGKKRWPALFVPLPIASLLVIGYAALSRPAKTGDGPLRAVIPSSQTIMHSL